MYEIIETFININDLSIAVLKEKKESDIYLLTDEFSKNKEEVIYSKLLNYFVKNTTEKELFAFIYASCKNIETCSLISKPFSKKIISIINSINFLINECGDEFVFELLSDADLITPLMESDKGRLFIGLMSVYLAIKCKPEFVTISLWELHEDFRSFKELYKLLNQILQNEDVKVCFFNSNKMKEIKKNIQDIISKDGARYKQNIKLDYKLLREIVYDNLLPFLTNQYIEISKFSKINKLENSITILSDNKYNTNTYKFVVKDYEIPSYDEEYIVEPVIKIIDDSKRYLLEFINLRIEEIKSETLSNVYEMTKELENISITHIELRIICEKISKSIKVDNVSLISLNKLELRNYVNDIILNSCFYGLMFTDICCELVNKQIEDNDLLDLIINRVQSNPEPLEKVDLLVINSNYITSVLLNKEYNLGLNIDFENDDKYLKMIQIENQLKINEYVIAPEYFKYKEAQKYGLALATIKKDLADFEVSIEMSNMELSKQLDDIKLKALKFKSYYFENRSNYLQDTYITINQALQLCEQVSDLKNDKKIKIANDILGEIEYLKTNKDSCDHLKILINEFNETKSQVRNQDEYLGLPLDTILEYLRKDKYELLGIRESIYKEISDSRKDDIEILIKNWLNLRNCPTTYEDAKKMNQDILIQLIELSKALGRICSLYLTNEDNRIGYEPFDEWQLNKDIPFTYTTKIKNPNCEALNQIIRIYIMTQNQLGSKAYINKIRDHISNKGYSKNSFSVILLIGNRNKFNELNTNAITKDIPVLDEIALKKIIFANEASKIPKWEFTNLLILTRNITDIQPFKSEGSVNSEMNIFVGRDNIIKEITSVPKDFAIYG